jgi:hypothetical protein
MNKNIKNKVARFAIKYPYLYIILNAFCFTLTIYLLSCDDYKFISVHNLITFSFGIIMSIVFYYLIRKNSRNKQK